MRAQAPATAAWFCVAVRFERDVGLFACTSRKGKWRVSEDGWGELRTWLVSWRVRRILRWSLEKEVCERLRVMSGLGVETWLGLVGVVSLKGALDGGVCGELVGRGGGGTVET